MSPSDTVEDDPKILRRVAIKAVADQRAAMKLAADSPTEEHQRAAYRLCVFAARALGTAAEHATTEKPRMLALANEIEAAGIAMRTKLVHTVLGADE